eukprot:TRINITY_DN44525_c0_g1_i1.p1 TRINITY_DN44525_c0_g1~~TRINITY_DN44525_c0_g1_i1.p1  ORF type:complete len:240 (+),score=125.87 TRINITY_DN44525_c0_g1_i1:141-860(+)
MLSRTGVRRCFSAYQAMKEKSIVKTAGRKSLDQIMKLELLQTLSSAQIMNMWITHHQLVMQYWGRVISAEAHNVLHQRLKENPYFVIPVFRDKGLFNVVTNFQTGEDDMILCSPLGEWQKLQDAATVHMTIQFFTELKQSKGIVLVRCEIRDNHLTKQDCMFVTHCLMKYYTMPQNFKHVETFNKDPNQFNYHNYLKQMRDEARVETGKGENIQILDEKRTWTSAYKAPTPSDPSAGSA